MTICMKRYITEDIVKLCKYGVSGVCGGCIQVGLLYVFVDIFSVWYIRGVVLAFSISLVATFFLQKYWTFQDYTISSVGYQSIRYILIALIALALNITFMYILVDIFQLWYIMAQIIVVGTIGVVTFLLNKRFTFNNNNITV